MGFPTIVLVCYKFLPYSFTYKGTMRLGKCTGEVKKTT